MTAVISQQPSAPRQYSQQESKELLEKFAELPAAVQTKFLEKAMLELNGNPNAIAAGMEGLVAAHQVLQQVTEPQPAVGISSPFKPILVEEAPSLSTQIAEAQIMAKDAAAKGQNVAAIASTIGAELGGAAFAQNVATQAVQEQQFQQVVQRVAVAEEMHKETVAKVEGRESPTEAPTNPFAAALMNSGFKASDVVASSMLQYHNAEAASVVGAGQKRAAEGVQLG